jgi:diguanylate cyclase (GGDEF)-like protein
MAVGWAVDRIDARELVEEQRYIAGGLEAYKRRVELEQDSSAAWDDAVINLRADNQPWIAENLVDWMSEFFSHDRVYVVGPDGAIVRAAAAGEALELGLDPRVAEMEKSLRQQMAQASAGMKDSTPAITGIGLSDTVRLDDGLLAFVSIRPVVPTTVAVPQSPGSEYLHVSVVLLGGQMLEELGRHAGLTDLRVGGPSRERASLPMLDNSGRTLGYVVWTPRKPALVLLKETAPAWVALGLLGSLSMGGLMMWLRRTTAKLEASRARIAFLAYHDPLTGAANRSLFELRLEEALDYEHLAQAKVALVSIDIDKFKEINDTWGHAAGDKLIKMVAERLSRALPEDATLTRLGGDEFALVHPGIVTEGHVRFLCETLLDSFRDPFKVSDQRVVVTASIGAALEAGSDTTASEMMHRADVALYAAKAAGRNCFRLYNPFMDQVRRDQRTLEVDLRNALLTGVGLHLLYQPIFGAQSGEIVGAEALIRWQHPVRGSLSPNTFISIAEDRGIIGELGLWVLDEATRFASNSQLPWIAVNVSPLQFGDPNFADRVFAVLVRHGLTPARLELEITEGLLLQGSLEVKSTLAKLRSAGIRIALDDFGTGYSSISQLRDHEIDKLKIDQSFTKSIGRDKAAGTIVRSIIEMAGALEMSVTAEGVEDEMQRERLRKLGCSSLQGYLLSRPISADRLQELLVLSKADVVPAGRLAAFPAS